MLKSSLALAAAAAFTAGCATQCPQTPTAAPVAHQQQNACKGVASCKAKASHDADSRGGKVK